MLSSNPLSVHMYTLCHGCTTTTALWKQFLICTNFSEKGLASHGFGYTHTRIWNLSPQTINRKIPWLYQPQKLCCKGRHLQSKHVSHKKLFCHCCIVCWSVTHQFSKLSTQTDNTMGARRWCSVPDDKRFSCICRYRCRYRTNSCSQYPCQWLPPFGWLCLKGTVLHTRSQTRTIQSNSLCLKMGFCKFGLTWTELSLNKLLELQ